MVLAITVTVRLRQLRDAHPDLLRDRWGYSLSDESLERIAVKLHAAMKEPDPVEYLAMQAGMGHLCNLASAIDTPPDDWHLDELMRVARGLPVSPRFVLVETGYSEKRADEILGALHDAGYEIALSVTDGTGDDGE